MSKNVPIFIFAGVVAVVLLVVFLMSMTYTNQEVGLRNQAVAQGKANEIIYDEVWKILQQKAGILEKFAEDFKNIYATIMEDRYQGEKNGPGPTFKWIQEHNPNFTPEMYKDLSVAIEAYRGKFSRVQQKLVDIKREHDNLCQMIPSKWLVGKVPELEIVIVTSTKTSATFATGKEDDINLFQKE
jgi:hypothetical protein